MNRMTPAVTVLIAINVVMFGLNSLSTVELNQWLALYYPSNPSYGIWQYVTSMFMHGGVMHILFNMLGLWMFGTALESIWGTRKFLFFYFAAGIGAGIIYTLVNYFQFTADFDQLRAIGMGALEIQQILDTGSYNANISGLSSEMLLEFYMTYHTPVLGASGAIYGVLVAFAITYPNSKLMLLFLPFPIAAKYFVPAILMIDLFSGVTGFSIFGAGIAHFAHLGGALIGFLLMMLRRNKA